MAGMDYEDGTWIPNYAWEKTPEFLEWLAGVDSSRFPHPTYKVGDRVRFKWTNGSVKTGNITKIWLVFDHKYHYEDCPEKLTERKNITYDIYWNGHSRWIKLEDILGLE